MIAKKRRGKITEDKEKQVDKKEDDKATDQNRRQNRTKMMKNKVQKGLIFYFAGMTLFTIFDGR